MGVVGCECRVTARIGVLPVSDHDKSVRRSDHGHQCSSFERFKYEGALSICSAIQHSILLLIADLAQVRSRQIRIVALMMMRFKALGSGISIVENSMASTPVRAPDGGKSLKNSASQFVPANAETSPPKIFGAKNP